MPSVGYQDYLDVASSRDVPTFERRLKGFAERLDFPLINASLVVEQPGSPASIVAIRAATKEFQSTVDPATARRDPVLQRLKTMSIPFVYDQGLYVSEQAGDLWDEQAPHGYKTGIAMALHMTGGRHFLLGIDRPDALPKDPDALIRLVADFQLLGVYAQETAVRLLLPQVHHSELPALNSREQEILRWARDGKSSAVIAQLLNISLSTVNYHLSIAMRKLGVATKHQAAAKANALGLL